MDFGTLLAGENLSKWGVSAAILLGFVALAFASRLILNLALRVLAHRTRTTLDDLVIKALALPLFLVLVVAGLHLALGRLPELADHVDIISRVSTVLYIFIAAIALVRLIGALLTWYASEVATRTKTNIDDKLIPLLRRVGSIVVYAVALLIILDQFNVNISPLIAGLGIGGLAVALALQSTLSNFLAGTYVMSDAVIHQGDYVTLDSGQ